MKTECLLPFLPASLAFGVISLSYSRLGLLISHYSPYHILPALGSIRVDSSSGCFSPLLHSYACTKFIFLDHKYLLQVSICFLPTTLLI